jgi:hypothetical protein
METTMWQQYKDQGIKVIAINSSAGDITNPTAVADYVSYLGPTYAAGTEITYTYGDFAAHYEGSNPFPIDVVIDKNGIIQYISREYDSAAMQAVVEPLL